MPRYDDDRSYHRRRSRSPKLLEGDDRTTSQRDRDHHRSSRRDKRRGSRVTGSPTSSRERDSRSGRSQDQGSRRHRSHSRGTRRRHRSRSEDRNEKKPSRRNRSRSLASKSPLRRRSTSPRPSGRSKKPLPSQSDAFSKTPLENSESSTPAPEKQKPNFSTSGHLAAETNTVRAQDGSASIVLKYHEPPEARKPPSKQAWRLYVFKDEDLLDTVELGGRSCWLIGKEQLVADLPIQHPSCSKQHAAIQFRYIEKRNEFGDRDGRVRPYVIDLESANGTTVNGEPAPQGRYMELMDKDILKFGLSTREYVLMLPPPG